ncbi:UbiX family flavin prenyltransferase [Methanomassiliicoccaceae archaeon COG_1]|nr:UbiX family flavin prenyltransferase [Methanomassiliicoccaceae archaeon COG_1]
MRYVVAITGASGAVYGVRLLQELRGEKVLVMSEVAKSTIPAETEYSVSEVEAMADVVCEDSDMSAPIASGSYEYDAMFVAPCTESSLAKFACGIADTLVSRAFACALKEGRRIVLVPRETPKSAIMLENELKLARLGVVILDANPGFYSRPGTVGEVVDFVVGRCLMQVGQKQELFRQWG